MMKFYMELNNFSNEQLDKSIALLSFLRENGFPPSFKDHDVYLCRNELHDVFLTSNDNYFGFRDGKYEEVFSCLVCENSIGFKEDIDWNEELNRCGKCASKLQKFDFDLVKFRERYHNDILSKLSIYSNGLRKCGFDIEEPYLRFITEDELSYGIDIGRARIDLDVKQKNSNLSFHFTLKTAKADCLYSCCWEANINNSNYLYYAGHEDKQQELNDAIAEISNQDFEEILSILQAITMAK